MRALIGKLKGFLLEARQEFRHVNWPTRQEATRLTGIVIALSVALSVFLGAFDYLFGAILKMLIARS